MQTIPLTPLRSTSGFNEPSRANDRCTRSQLSRQRKNRGFRRLIPNRGRLEHPHEYRDETDERCSAVHVRVLSSFADRRVIDSYVSG